MIARIRCDVMDNVDMVASIAMHLMIVCDYGYWCGERWYC